MCHDTYNYRKFNVNAKLFTLQDPKLDLTYIVECKSKKRKGGKKESLISHYELPA